MDHKRVCIVGGGASGLACARVLGSSEYNLEPTVFEQNPFIGGQWHYDPTGSLETTAVYKNLRTNLPCSVMQFTDFPFANHEPDSYVGYKEMEEYLIAYAEHFKLSKYIILNAKVISIDETFTVMYTVTVNSIDQISTRPYANLVTKDDIYATYIEKFDAVCVANGHYTEVYIPNDIPGFETRTFPTHHSHSYREPEHFKDKCIVVVGASHSGVDISGELAAVAKQVILSMKKENTNNFEIVLSLLQESGKILCTDYLQTTFSFRPTIERIENDTVYFKDQTSIKPDALIFATGYEYRVPFLQGKLQVDTNRLYENRYLYPLYKQLFHADFPNGTLSFLAIPFRIVPFPLAELQSHMIGRVLNGKMSLPISEKMKNEIDSLALPRNRTYHCVNMVHYTEDLLRMMSESDKYFKYKFLIDDRRRVRKLEN